MTNRKTLAIVLLIASVMSFCFAWFFLMDAPIPYSEEAQQKGFYHFISLFMGIGLALSSFIVSKIWEGTFLWKVHLTLVFVNVAVMGFTAYLTDVWMSDAEQLALIEYGLSQGREVSKQVGNFFLDVMPGVCFFSALLLVSHVGFDIDFRKQEEDPSYKNPWGSPAEKWKFYFVIMGLNFGLSWCMICIIFYDYAYPYLFGKI